MASASLCRVNKTSPDSFKAVIRGSVLFAISDSVLAYNKFVPGKFFINIQLIIYRVQPLSNEFNCYDNLLRWTMVNI